MVEYGFTIIQKKATDKIYNISVKDGDNIAINLTGATVYVTVKTATDTSTDDSTALITKEITSHTDAVNGLTQFTFTKENTNLSTGTYLIDIKIYKNSLLLSNNYVGAFKITDTSQNSLY